MSALGIQIKCRRLDLELTQDELAKRAGLSKGFLSDLETGKRSISAEKLLDLARVLGTSLDSLMGADAAMASSLGEVQIPARLAELAKMENLPFVKTLMLLDMQRQIVAHRSQSKPSGLDNVDWRHFYESVKEFL